MGIRKFGSATGEVTGVEAPGEGGIRAEAAAGSHAWVDGEDQLLADENEAADKGDD